MARSADGPVPLLADTSVRVDSYDRFLTTDPQYIITVGCRNFIEITFHLRVLTLFEAEQNVYNYAQYMRSDIQKRDEKINRYIADRDSAMTELGRAIAKLYRVLCSNAWKITALLRKVVDRFKSFLKGNS